MRDHLKRIGALCIAVALLAPPAPGNEITILCDGVGGTVADGGPGDLNHDS